MDCIDSMRVSHCIWNSIEKDLRPPQNLKSQINMSWDGYFLQYLFKQNTLDLLPFLKFESSVLGIGLTKVTIMDVGGATSEYGLCTTSLEYVNLDGMQFTHSTTILLRI